LNSEVSPGQCRATRLNGARYTQSLSLKKNNHKWDLGCLCFLEEEEWELMVATILNHPPAMPPGHGSDPEPPAQHTKVNGYQLQVTILHSCKWSKVRSKFMLEPPMLWSRQLEGISFSRSLPLRVYWCPSETGHLQEEGQVVG